ncbi:MAG TPA: cupin domain-containing protein [Thermoanaerobaculia bacterium]|nr:cupin domain-containing protein [Thermoanaerobaculia bacterium]
MRFTVDRLLEPFSFSQFCEEWYEKRPLFIGRKSPAYYDGVLTLDALNAQLQLDQEDEEDALARLYAGHPVAIPYELPLRHELERVFHAPVASRVYLMPAGGGRRAAGSDAFILQFAGTTEWVVRDLTATLEPGDLLYVPGKFRHEARPSNALSAHIAFTLEKFTYADLLRHIADNAHASEWLRKSLPPDFRSVAASDEFLRHVHEFFDDADLPAYLERMHSDFAEERVPDSTNRLADYVSLPSIGAASRFRKRLGLWPELTNGGDKVELTFHRKSLEFPAAAAASLRAMIDAEEFAASALPGLVDANLALCRTLVREGFLTIV